LLTVTFFFTSFSVDEVIIGRTRDSIYPMFAFKLELEYFREANSDERHAQDFLSGAVTDADFIR